MWPSSLQSGTKRAARVIDLVRRPMSGLVVLIYHRVGAATGVPVDLPLGLFEQQMAELAERGAPMTLDAAVHDLRRGCDLSGRVVVTFDDGTVDVCEQAVPILEKYRVPATLYLATAFVEEQRMFPDDGRPTSWAALRDAQDTGWLTVESHTHDHLLLDRLAPDLIADQLDRSIDLIGDRLGTAARHFAYPKALAGSAVAERQVARRFVSAALAGTCANPVGADVYRLARSPIQVSDGMRWFRQKVAGGMTLEDEVRQIVNRRRYEGATS